MAPNKVANACQRCRRQKLKCDIGRPCVLCLRVGTDCVSGDGETSKSNSQRQRPVKRRRAIHPQDANSDEIDYAQHVSADEALPISGAESTQNFANVLSEEYGSQNGTDVQSSSTVALINTVYHLHENHGSPEVQKNIHSAHSRGGANTSSHGVHSPLCVLPVKFTLTKSAGNDASIRLSRFAVNEMTRLLPSLEVVDLLVNTYFDRVHWFLLLFHQDDFRAEVQTLFHNGEMRRTGLSLDLLSKIIAVCVIGLEYLGPSRVRLLSNLGLHAQELKDKMLGALGQRLLEIVALGTLDAIQTCVLLGTYHLYHGRPDLAWPICGCALRLAQALNLHRTYKRKPGAPKMVPTRTSEAQKRCWWAIYEIETFCAMLYGLPPTISDSDCDVEMLDPRSKNKSSNIDINGSNTVWPGNSLLAYKPKMSELSIIVKAALTALYQVQINGRRTSSATSKDLTQLNETVRNVQSLEDSLRSWHEQLPHSLSWSDTWDSNLIHHAIEQLEDEIGANGPIFETLILRQQSLALKLAYENARILIHRPLLTLKMTSHSTVSTALQDRIQITRACQQSTEICREAALHIAALGSHPIFQQACGTYAAAFIGTNIFTAGITLCITASLDPLSNEAREDKLGLQRLLRMQNFLRTESDTVVDSEKDILTKLIKLVMEKELSVILSPPAADPSQDRDPSHSEPNISSATGLPGSVSRGDQARHQPHRDSNQITPERQEGVIDTDVPTLTEDPTTERLVQSITDIDEAVGQWPWAQPDASIMAAFDQMGQDEFLDQQQGWIWGFDFTQIQKKTYSRAD